MKRQNGKIRAGDTAKNDVLRQTADALKPVIDFVWRFHAKYATWLASRLALWRLMAFGMTGFIEKSRKRRKSVTQK